MKQNQIFGMRLVSLFLFLAAFSACNFHEVDPGKLYRSAQLSGDEFSEAIEKLGIKTVINLRGASPGKDWFDEEAEAIRKFPGVEHINIKMSAQRIPHRKDLITLLDAFKTAQRPILIHCKGGADRTGEAAAIYQMEYMGKTKEEALEMLTPTYNHFALFTPAKHYFISLYQGQDWAYEVYDPCKQKYEYYKDRYCH